MHASTCSALPAKKGALHSDDTSHACSRREYACDVSSLVLFEPVPIKPSSRHAHIILRKGSKRCRTTSKYNAKDPSCTLSLAIPIPGVMKG